jgi:soluble lytic murein transglycosylase-like protein
MGAKGLMQVMPNHHQDKLAAHGGVDAVLDPMTNILTGAMILKDYVRRGGSIEAGLQMYVGAYGDDSNPYPQKVLAEKDRLDKALRRNAQPAVQPNAITASFGA